MKLSKGSGLALGALLCAGLQSQSSWGWGATGHQIIGEVGARLVSGPGAKFFQANEKNLGFLANVPDNTWKRGSGAAQEKPNHWFQPDSYYENQNQFRLFPHLWSEALAQYGQTKLVENGTAPWRIQQLFDLAVAAFRKGDLTEGLQMAGTMAHYIGDLSQPLHVTKNYDGQESGDKGLHKFFETDNLKSIGYDQLEAAAENEAEKVISNPSLVAALEQGTVVDFAFQEIYRAYPYKDKIIDADLKLGRKGKGGARMLDIAKPRLGDGAATLALVLGHLWEAAGNPSGAASLKISAPEWVPPEFSDAVVPPQGPATLEHSYEPEQASVEKIFDTLEEDDCNL